MTSVRCKKIWPVPLIVEVVISAALFGCNDSSNTHSDTYYYPIVIKEADALPDFPGASIVEKDAGKKYANAWSRKRLRVKDGYDPVVQFYDEELLNRGWRKFDSYGSMNLSRVNDYCKDAIKFELSVSRPQTPGITDYAVGVYWLGGSKNPCNEG
jgi:hypothetical protein